MASVAEVVGYFLQICGWLAASCAAVLAAYWAYEIRLYAIKEYGPVIHEFDPWFNFRATQYLADHGWHAFFTWFDHMSWYPLGRPVATTIYPGMQIASVAIWQSFSFLNLDWSLNDVCAYVPAWFGSVATFFTMLLTYESSGSCAGAVAAAAVMAILPAHARRSVGGGFDNESVAIPAMCATFYFWCRCLRSERSWPIAAIAGLAYTFMVSSWGGYIFTINVIGLHVVALVLLGHYSHCLYRSYSLFFMVGTAGAILVPVVGWTPLRSLEQIGPLATFVCFQIIELVKICHSRNNRKASAANFGVVVVAGAITVGFFALLIPTGLFGPLSGRVRALLGHHATKTGNPLVDSVAEHQPSSPDAYWTNLLEASYTALIGVFALFVPFNEGRLGADGYPEWPGAYGRPSPAAIFLAILSVSTYFFSSRMSRLIVLIALPAASLSGVAMGWLFDWSVSPIWRTLHGPSKRERSGNLVSIYNSQPCRVLRLALAIGIGVKAWPIAKDFYGACHNKVKYSMSHPQIMSKSGSTIIDDYREAYWWLRDKTPTDARVMAWWDYGYQIAGIANRSTIADGNTWNMDHIGLLGLCLSSPVAEAHKIARHLADYVLVWTGQGGGDDLGKSTHMARISNSVYKGHCSSIDCNQFGVFRDGKPTNMMGASLIWLLTGRAGKEALRNGNKFQQVFESSHGRVRIVKVLQVSEESRTWAANTENRLCDAPGSWYCPGQYPPLLRELFDKTVVDRNAEAASYQAAYEKRLLQQEAEKPKPHGAGIPKGSYLDSCEGCSIVQSQLLRCTHCKVPGAPSVASELDVAKCGEPVMVDNIQSALQCKPPPNAKDIPPGGYSRSCQGCRLDGELVVCSDCDTAEGGRRASSYRASQCPPPGKLDNRNGHLICIGLPNARGIPVGGYAHSCEGCSMDGETLRCLNCASADGGQRESSIQLDRCKPPANIDNDNGVLSCKGLHSSHEIPEGGYRSSCQGCQFESNSKTLSCSHCRAADGKQHPSSYDLDRCVSPAELDNLNGILTCKGVPNRRAPKGPYLDSCQGCNLDSGSLRCTHCRTADGRQVETSLSTSTCLEPTRWGNQNGRLVCEDA